MIRRTAIILLIISTIILTADHLSAMPLEEAMLRLQVEALKAQMDEYLARNEIDRAKEILAEMVKLDEKIRSFRGEKAEVYVNISDQKEQDKDHTEEQNKSHSGREKLQSIAVSDDIMGTYEKVTLDTCRRMDFDPAVIWTLLAIESNFSKDPVVVQKRTKCLGPWQHQPEHYIHYRKHDGTPYNPFDIRDACEVTVRIMKDNLASTGSMDKAIRMYCSGSRFLDRPYEKLPKAVRSYLDKFGRIYPEARNRFGKYGIYK